MNPEKQKELLKKKIQEIQTALRKKEFTEISSRERLDEIYQYSDYVTAGCKSSDIAFLVGPRSVLAFSKKGLLWSAGRRAGNFSALEGDNLSFVFKDGVPKLLWNEKAKYSEAKTSPDTAEPPNNSPPNL